MIRRTARLMLVLALVSTSGSAPFAHVHPRGHDHGASGPEDSRAHTEGAQPTGPGTHWHQAGHHTADLPGATKLPSNGHHHASVALVTVAVERTSVFVDSTDALIRVRATGIVPDPPGRPVPVPATARSKPPPRIVLAARAPPA